MEVEITARATGPYGELRRKQRLTDSNYPLGYLQHLVEIGVATVLVEHRVEPVLEAKVPKEKKISSASPQAPVSQERTVKKRRGRPRKSSSSTTTTDFSQMQNTSTPATKTGGSTTGKA